MIAVIGHLNHWETLDLPCLAQVMDPLKPPMLRLPLKEQRQRLDRNAAMLGDAGGVHDHCSLDVWDLNPKHGLK